MGRGKPRRGKPRARDPRLKPLEQVASALEAAPRPEPAPIELTQAQLMQAAFDALGDGSTLDWSRIRIVDRSPTPEPQPQPEPQPHSEPQPQPQPTIGIGQAKDWNDSIPNPPNDAALLATARARRLPELNLRYLPLEDALAQLEDFTTMLVLAGVEFARVITGKGISSCAGPVIRPQAIEWCRASRSVHRVVEEVDHYGEIGTLIVQIRRDWR